MGLNALFACFSIRGGKEQEPFYFMWILCCNF